MIFMSEIPYAHLMQCNARASLCLARRKAERHRGFSPAEVKFQIAREPLELTFYLENLIRN